MKFKKKKMWYIYTMEYYSEAGLELTMRPCYFPVGHMSSHRTSTSDKDIWGHDTVRQNKPTTSFCPSTDQTRQHCAPHNGPNLSLCWQEWPRLLSNYSCILTLVFPPYREDSLTCPVTELPTLPDNTQSRVSPSSIHPPQNHPTRAHILYMF